jgi:thymidylate synthase (FAD)
MGIAREISRINLPLSLYTQWYWQMDLHNLFHFLRLRLDAHAQYEIRVYAQQIFELIRTVCPIACEAFEEHRLNGVSFSGSEMDALKQMLEGKDNPLSGRAKEIFTDKLKR